MRATVVVFGIATGIFFLLGIGTVTAEAAYLQPWWTPVAAGIVFGVPPVLALTCRFLTLRTLRKALAGYAIAYLVFTLSFVPSMTTWPMPIALSPWVLGNTALGTVAAGLVWSSRVTWGYLLALIASMAPVRFIADGYDNIGIALQDAFFSLAFTAIFTAIALVSVRNGRSADAAAAQARTAAASASSAQARVRERARLDALVHDEVLATLFYATTGTPEVDAAVARQAQRALTNLAALDSGTDPVPADSFVSRLRSATALSASVEFELESAPTRDVPADVAAAFVEAAAEAVRNAIVHAYPGGGDGKVFVRVRNTAGGLVVTITDEGRGFTRRSVAAHRLGIRVSIVGRMAVVPGGEGRVDSTPGHGTVVTLSWTSS